MNNSSGENEKKKLTPPPQCATCRNTVAPDSRFKPFCSERCKLGDLWHWMSESYSVPCDPLYESESSSSEDALDSVKANRDYSDGN